MERVEIERAYRIVAALRKSAADLEQNAMPLLTTALQRWRNRTLLADAVMMIVLIVSFMSWSVNAGHWHGLNYQAQWLDVLNSIEGGVAWFETLLILALIGGHFGMRKLAVMSVLPWLRQQIEQRHPPGNVLATFHRNSRFWRTILLGRPIGWNRQSALKWMKCCKVVKVIFKRLMNVLPIREVSASRWLLRRASFSNLEWGVESCASRFRHHYRSPCRHIRSGRV
ncbi:hypothetical protein [Chromatium okenii]|uniref:hypothetical protein n=1 Tax=Chromatium okenii TaxID=61644 RepID=UPI003221F3C4